MSISRGNLGFEAELEAFDPSEWDNNREKNPLKEKPTKADVKAAAASAGFKSREPVRVSDPKPQRRRTTGRNQQLNIKAQAQTIDAFYSVADAQGWGLGETLEYAVVLLQNKYQNKK